MAGAAAYDGHEALIGIFGGAPSMVPRFYAHQSLNRFYRSDENLTRPSFREIPITFESDADRIWFAGGNGQGSATNQLAGEQRLKDFLIAGELSLSGATRTVRGGLSIALLARSLQKRGVILPLVSAQEAALVSGIEVYGVESLTAGSLIEAAGTFFPVGESLLMPK